MELVKKGVVCDRDASVNVTMTPPYFFRLRRFKKNVLFSMFEFDALPNEWIQYLNKADLLIVPCSQNKKVFSSVSNTPVEICPGGVDAELFPYRRREKTKPFTFLFVGAYNNRKGTWHIAKAWELWNQRYPELASESQLIMKMTSPTEEPILRQLTPNAYIDLRVLPLTDHDGERLDLPTLASVYDFANCFLFPTMGEGWGLPLCEAMSSGLPSIYTPFGGTEDTANAGYAYPVEYEMKTVYLCNPLSEQQYKVNAPSPLIESIVDRMHKIYVDYEAALDKAELAAYVMRSSFRWDQAADRFIEIISQYYPEAC